jgi:hypothetical protein
MTKHVKHSEKLGRKAFNAGLKCVPALDAEFREHLKAVDEMGWSVLVQLDAWLRGWTAENLEPDSEWVERNLS